MGGKLGREAQEGGDVCVPVAGLCCYKQKPTQQCKTIILQLKTMLKKELPSDEGCGRYTNGSSRANGGGGFSPGS